MHTIPNGDPPRPFAGNTAMSGTIVLPPLTVGEEFHKLRVDDDKTIHFHALVPLYEDEMDLKLEKGAEALFDGFEKHHVTELLQVARSSTVARKKSFFNFWKKR